MTTNDDYNILYEAIGYFFKNKDLIVQALIHRSKRKNHNERLEFLGDSILSFIIAESLYLKFPHRDEGQLSLLRMYLVRGDTLCKIAKYFNLGSYIILGFGEIKSGGYEKPRLLEDAFEALIGAIYLDSDFNTIKSCILSWYKDEFISLDIEDILYVKDVKTRLQEYVQHKNHTYPIYKILKIEGLDHDKRFFVELSLEGLDRSFHAQGKSRKEAERNAANIALSYLFSNSN